MFPALISETCTHLILFKITNKANRTISNQSGSIRFKNPDLYNKTPRNFYTWFPD